MYRQIIIQHIYVQHIPWIYGICFDLSKNAINSLYNINWLVKITEISPSKSQWTLNVPPNFHLTTLRSAHLLNLSVLCGSDYKKRVLEYTTLTAYLYNRDFYI